MTTIIVAAAAALAVTGGVITMALYAFKVISRLTGEVKSIHDSYQKEVEGNKLLANAQDDLRLILSDYEKANLKLKETLDDLTKERDRELASRKLAESQRDQLLTELAQNGDPKKVAGHINDALAKLAALNEVP